MKIQYFLILICVGVLIPSRAHPNDLNPLLASQDMYQDIRVARVLAVDRILLENDRKVSLIGVKGPRAPKQKDVRRDSHGFIIPEGDPTTPFEVEAIDFARGLVEGKPVRIEFDTQRRGDNGDVQAYVILPDGRLMNAEVLRYGYADLKLSPPNMKYADKLRTAYQEARREMRGMQGAW
jgi:micrococcal nuclease